MERIVLYKKFLYCFSLRHFFWHAESFREYSEMLLECEGLQKHCICSEKLEVTHEMKVIWDMIAFQNWSSRNSSSWISQTFSQP